MGHENLKIRTKQFALRIIDLVGSLPNTAVGRALGGQLVRSGTSVGANYRSACRSRSRKQFIAKLGVVEEEADESAYWIELVQEALLMDEKLVHPLWREANELVAIMAQSRKTARSGDRPAAGGERPADQSLDTRHSTFETS